MDIAVLWIGREGDKWLITSEACESDLQESGIRSFIVRVSHSSRVTVASLISVVRGLLKHVDWLVIEVARSVWVR